MEMNKELAQFIQQSKSICHRFDLMMTTNAMVKIELAKLREKVKAHLTDESKLGDSRKLAEKMNATLKWALEALSIEDIDSDSGESDSDIQPQFDSDVDSFTA